MAVAVSLLRLVFDCEQQDHYYEKQVEYVDS